MKNKVIKRYVPSKIIKFIQSSDFTNKEDLIVVCDMVVRIGIYRGRVKKNSGYTDWSNRYIDIPRDYFRDIITRVPRLKEAIDYLKSNNILLCDGKYSKDKGKALGYAFNEDYISDIAKYNLSNSTINKRIIKNKNNRKMNVNNSIKEYRKYFLSNMKIDADEAFLYIRGIYNEEVSKFKEKSLEWIAATNKYNHYFISIAAIDDGDLFFKRNLTNGRIDSNLTNLPSDLRKFLKIKGLKQIDIVNSQPVFLSSLLLPSLLCGDIEKSKSMKSFIDKCFEGKLYEHIFSFFYKKTQKQLTRKEIKSLIFCILYSQPSSYPKEKSIFKQVFPDVLDWIENRKSKDHNKFAIQMQKEESQMCIDTILPLLHINNIPCFTIHDSWMMLDEHIPAAHNIIKNAFIDKYGRSPAFKIEEITK